MEIMVDFPGGARVDAHFGGMTIQTDQPPPTGENSAPSPFNTFLASLGTCAGYYVLAFCRQRGISTEGLRLIEKTEVDRETHMTTLVRLEIILPPDFPEKYKSAVIRAADQCAVKKHIEHPPKFDVRAEIAETRV